MKTKYNELYSHDPSKMISGDFFSNDINKYQEEAKKSTFKLPRTVSDLKIHYQ